MNSSSELNEIAKALAEFAAEKISIAKNSTNPHFKNRYADLASIIAAVQAPLSKHGLAVAQLPRGDVLETVLMHRSGQFIASETPIRSAKADAQGYGGGLTYARRYALCAILNLAADDDDGETAAGRSTASQRREITPRAEKKSSEYYTTDEAFQKLGEIFPGKASAAADWLANPARKNPTSIDKMSYVFLTKVFQRKEEILKEMAAEDAEKAKTQKNHIADDSIFGD